MSRRVLIVEDDPAQRRHLSALVGALGFTVETASGGAEGLGRLNGGRPAARGEAGDGNPQDDPDDPDRDIAPIDLMLLDMNMEDVDGIEVLRRARPKFPNLPILMLTANGSVNAVVDAMKAGATDFLVKPVAPARLEVSIRNALTLTDLSSEVRRLAETGSNRLGFDTLVAASPQTRRSIRLAERAAQSGIPVLIEGESGVGKEVFARAIHGSSERAGKPFVAVNCGALPENLVESILFGHEKGAFTGATSRRVGKFQEADGGTLFLDEIGELPLDIQVKLLRAIQEGEVDPVGGSRVEKVDIRLVSATNRNLEQRVAEGAFREDLFYRINVFPLTVPPLRERAEDVAELSLLFARRFAAEEGKAFNGFTPEAISLLTGFDWPGNVRQLENTIYHAIVVAEDTRLSIDDFPTLVSSTRARAIGVPAGVSAPGGPGGALPAAPGNNGSMSDWSGEIQFLSADNGHVRTLASVEKEMISRALRRYQGQMSEIARRLGIGRSTLYRKVESYNLDPGVD